MKHDPHLANDLIIKSLVAKIDKLTARVEALEQRERDREAIRKVTSRVAVEVPQTLKAEISMAEICATVAHVHGLPKARMKAKFGPRYETDARSEFCSIAHDQGFSYPMIGKFLGGRDHTSVMHLVLRHKRKAGL